MKIYVVGQQQSKCFGGYGRPIHVLPQSLQAPGWVFHYLQSFHAVGKLTARSPCTYFTTAVKVKKGAHRRVSWSLNFAKSWAENLQKIRRVSTRKQARRVSFTGDDDRWQDT